MRVVLGREADLARALQPCTALEDLEEEVRGWEGVGRASAFISNSVQLHKRSEGRE